jgi:glutamate-1-semialdehyde 2,1-aminomutase
MRVAFESIREEYVTRNPKSREIYGAASRLLPGGVARTAVFFPPYPFYSQRGHGSRILDVDGNERIDYCFNYSALILGHSHEGVRKAILDQLERGTCLGAPTELEAKLAERIVERLPSIDQVRFTVSGTEAVMNALRLLRAYTGRKKIIKFEGAYHGTYDSVWTAVSQLGTLGPRTRSATTAECEGIPHGSVEDTIVAPFNNTVALERTVKEYRDELAGILVEPVLADAGCFTPRKEFLERARELARETGALLLFDEITTGFRLSPGGAQQFYGVMPDVTTFGKVVGGGFAIGGVAASAEMMKLFEIPHLGKPRIPLSGTFNGHPIALAAGLAVLGELKPETYDALNRHGQQLRESLSQLTAEYQMPAQITGVGSLFHIFFTEQKDLDYQSASEADSDLLHYFDLGLLNEGVYLPHLHWANVSAATTDEDVANTRLSIERALDKLKQG